MEFLRRRKLQFPEMTLLDDRGEGSRRPSFPVYPEPGGLLMWGNTPNADHCMWLTDPDPEKWTIVIENADFWHFKGGLLFPRFLGCGGDRALSADGPEAGEAPSWTSRPCREGCRW